MKYFKIQVEFKPQDFWVGAYWQKDPCSYRQDQVNVWVCLVPMFPIHMSWLVKVGDK